MIGQEIMRMRATLILAGMLAGAALLTGCALTGEEADASPGKPTLAKEVISFTAGPCFGACPSYTVKVNREGSGLLEPKRFTAVPGPTRFTVTPAQFMRLKTALARYRPAAGAEKRIAHGENCTRFATDMPGYVIEWAQGEGKPARLEYQSGCMDPQYGRLRTTIAAIPKMLEIEAMLKPKSGG
jgi:hypothetical protein